MMNKPNLIKFIYFDVGGVVLLDYSKTDKWNQMISDLKFDNKELFKEIFGKHEPQICTGEDIEVFMRDLEKSTRYSFPQNYNMIEDFVSRFEVNDSISTLIKKLKQKYKIGLLTNQYPRMLNMIFKKNLIPDVEWDVIIDSSVEKIKKPDQEIYLLAEKRARANPENILFVDNGEKHLKIPKERGWMTFEYDPSDPINSTKKLEQLIEML